MFGLIKHEQLTKEHYVHFKKNYCGTCKTIGKLYGQKERLLLNNDVVFLSELLSEINNCDDDFKYIKVNACFRLPKDEKTIPDFLKYTAAVNIVLAYYKMTDNIEDARHKLNIWHILKYLQNRNFKKANKQLQSFSLDVNLIKSRIQEQFKREQKKIHFTDIRDAFTYYSILTGQITAEIFNHGAYILNKPHFASILYSIGFNYGKIIYLIDAIADYRKDIKNKTFNLFTLYDNTKNSNLDPVNKQQAYKDISSMISEIEGFMKLLPVPEIRLKVFMNRISESINSKFQSATMCSNRTSKEEKCLSIHTRINRALKTARSFSGSRGANAISKYALFASLIVISFLLSPFILQASQPGNHEEPDKCCNTCGDCCCDAICSGCCDCSCG